MLVPELLLRNSDVEKRQRGCFSYDGADLLVRAGLCNENGLTQQEISGSRDALFQRLAAGKKHQLIQ